MGEALPWWSNPCPRPSVPGVGSSGSESGPQSPGLVLIQDERGLELSALQVHFQTLESRKS